MRYQVQVLRGRKIIISATYANIDDAFAAVETFEARETRETRNETVSFKDTQPFKPQ